MLHINDSCKEYFEKVKEFAEKTGQMDQLNNRLEYLGSYACHKTPEDTRCVLYSDFAPYSFFFSMQQCVIVREHECGCGHRFTEPVKYTGDTPNISCEKTVWCPRCGKKPLFSSPHKNDYVDWFVGGLIYHGEHDRGGDGEAPTFSVNLTPQNGWSVHT